MNTNFLAQKYPLDHLPNLITPRADWQPYPPDAWDALPVELRQNLIALGEDALTTPWPHLPATLYLRYVRDGNRAAFEADYFRRRNILVYLVLAECVEKRGRFLDSIANAVWSICEESTWCLPAHIGAQEAGTDLPDVTEPIVDLFAAETGMILAWTHYLHSPRLSILSPLLPARIEHEIQTRILAPALARDDFWWMGFTPREVNNWNPWINSNWLAAALLVESDEGRRLQAVDKILRSLDRFIVPYPEDGGCDEGPSYWGRAGASLYDCLELLYAASNGAINVYADPKIQNIGRFIYRAHIADDYYVNFADAPALVSPDGALVAGYGQRIGDAAMLAMGAWLIGRSSQGACFSPRDPGRDLTRALAAIFPHPHPKPLSHGERGDSPPPVGEGLGVRALPPLLRDIYLPNIQFFAARDQAGTSAGLYLAAKGGHNDESHNHNDVGHFIVYHDGKPLIIDVGVEVYTRKTFSPQRYEIWTMQSAYHSLPTVDGVMQCPGRQFAARNVDVDAGDKAACFALDIATAYPPEAHLNTWKRQITLKRGECVELVDAYECSQTPGVLTFSLMTPCQVDLSATGQVSLGAVDLPEGRSSASGRITYDSQQFTVTCDEISIHDARMGPAWGERVTRILFQVRAPAMQGQWKLTIEGFET
jgi:hypothetical protein